MALHCWKCGGLCVSSVSSMCQRNFQIQEDESQLEGGTQQHIAIQGFLEWCIGLKQQKLLSFFPHRYVSCLRFFEKRRWVLSAALSNRGALFSNPSFESRRMLQSFCQTLRCYGGVPLSRSLYQGRTLMRNMFFCFLVATGRWRIEALQLMWQGGWIESLGLRGIALGAMSAADFFGEKHAWLYGDNFFVFFFEDQTFPQLLGGGIFHDQSTPGKGNNNTLPGDRHIFTFRGSDARSLEISRNPWIRKGWCMKVTSECVRFSEIYTKLHT